MIAAIPPCMILILKARNRKLALSKKGSNPLIPIDIEAKKREIRNNLRFPIRSSRDGKMNGKIKAGRDHDAKTNPVVAVSTSFFCATNGNEG